MMNNIVHNNTITTVFICFCLLCLLAGCGKEESPDTQKSARQKIPVDREVADQPPRVPAKSQPAQPQNQTGDKEAGASEQRPDVDTSQQPSLSKEKAKTDISESTDEKSGDTDTQQADNDVEEITVADKTSTAPASDTAQGENVREENLSQETEKDVSSAAIEGIEAIEIDLEPERAPQEETDSEDSEISFNPFEPLFEEDETAAVAEGTGAAQGGRKDRKLLTPLEKMSLGQIEVKGIIRAPSGNRAIVTDAKGKGYVVKKGTYIGMNSGQVEKIVDNKIIIIEMVGGRRSETELKLQKDTGE
ncbi:MAG: pilus assembly protein PilP [Thermodesulfobacteriota bacterium]|nr:pilus assembly protein PilP [Thermodesulfobacteriota bacterium]